MPRGTGRLLPLVVVKVYCLPPDLEAEQSEALSDYLESVEADIENYSPDTIGDVTVGISLVQDVSEHRIGDVIWMEVEYRGVSEVRAIKYAHLEDAASRLLRGLKGLVINCINVEGRLQDESRVPCSLISVTVGSENGPVTATLSDDRL